MSREVSHRNIVSWLIAIDIKDNSTGTRVMNCLRKDLLESEKDFYDQKRSMESKARKCLVGVLQISCGQTMNDVVSS